MWKKQSEFAINLASEADNRKQIARTSHNTEIFQRRSNLGRLYHSQNYFLIPIPVATCFKAWVCVHFRVAITGSNTARGTGV
jgi:hypothetical protein